MSRLAVPATLALTAVAAALAPAAPAAAQAPAPSVDRLGRCPAGGGERLAVAARARGTVTAGRFRVRLTRAQLTVAERDGGHLLWSSVPGEPFVGAARGSQDWRGQGGFLVGRTTLTACWRAQTVDRRRGLTLRGRLRGGAGGPAQVVPYTLTLRPAARDRLRLVVRLRGRRANVVILTASSTPRERVHGFGAMTRWNLKGAVLPVITREQGVGRGAEPLTSQQNAKQPGSGGSFATTYAVVPQYLTSRDRGFFLESPEVSIFDLRAARRIRVQLFSPTLTAQVLAGRTPAQLVRAYTGYAGRMRPLPRWVDRGAIVGVQGGTARVREVVAQLRAAGVPLAGVWLQDWVGQRVTSFGRRLWWNWVLDRERYPGWDQLVADLRAQGIRVLTYVNPMLVDAAGRPVDRNLFAEARDRGYLVRRPDGSPYLIDQGGFESGTVDLSDPAARRWMGGVLVDMARKYRASGWMADFGEQLPFDARLANGDAAAWHNRFPAGWAKVNAGAMRSAGLGDDTVQFYRAAFTTSPRYARLFWMGDQNVDWSREDGMPSALSGMLSAGLSGFALNHSDTGGYTTQATPPEQRSAELLLRWAEMNAFGGAMLRTHEGNRPDVNVQPYSSPQVARAFARWAAAFRALAPYRRGLERTAARTGLPIVRPLWLTWPRDRRAERLATEFTLGRDVLVAPAFAPGQTRTSAYLPRGRWVHLWSGRTYASAGRGVTVASPLGRPAVFTRAGARVGRTLAAALRG
jgi:alpha-glucosidase